MTFLKSLKKYPKDWMIVLLVVLIGFFAVMGWHFSDVANKPFWWKFWEVIAVGCIVLWLVGWLYLNSKEKSNRR